MKQYKKDVGLPALKELHELDDKGLVAEVDRKISIFEKYAASQRTLYTTMVSMGWDVSRVMERVAELELALIARKQELEAEGRSVLEDDAWVNGRKMLMDDVKFIHKHGLDVSRFKSEVATKTAKDADSIFTVENVDKGE
jgi:hypothetical protein